MIPHNRPCVTAEDRAAVDSVLASGWIAQGPAVAALEALFVARHGGGGACAVSSGTAALFLAIRALGEKQGTVVAMPSYSCSALLNAVFMAGATPRVVDVRTDSFCIDPDALAENAADAQIVVAVHTFGAPADVTALQAGGRAVIEDCCQALGGSVDGIPLGTRGAASIFSFYASKIVTGGQGGLVWSSSAATVANVRDYREFDGRDHYVPRFNLQMTDIQAALVGSQMARIEAIRARRAQIAGAYLSALPTGLGSQSGIGSPGRMTHRFVVVAPDSRTRDRLRTHMQSAGIACIAPIERFELLHRYLGLNPEAFPAAEQLADVALSLPLHLQLTDDDVTHISNTLSDFLP